MDKLRRDNLLYNSLDGELCLLVKQSIRKNQPWRRIGRYGLSRNSSAIFKSSKVANTTKPRPTKPSGDTSLKALSKRAFGDPSSELSKFNMAAAAGEYTMLPDERHAAALRQSNFEQRIKAQEPLLRSLI